MLRALVRYFATGPDRPAERQDPALVAREYQRRRWSVFLSAAFGYGIFYLCRVNLSVVTQPMVDGGVLSPTEIGFIGSAMLVVYAVSKLGVGFLADRSNIRRLMSTGLLCSALINLALGSMRGFVIFAAGWALNGLAQATGSAPSVVAISHWFSPRERGTRYGIWSVSHSIGEGLTFAATAWLVATAGWRWGFWGPGLVALGVALILFRTLADRPQTYGLPPVTEYRNDRPAEPGPSDVSARQREVLRTPAIWVLGLASATLYVARYGMDHWGVFFLQKAKGYSLKQAGGLMGTFPLLGLAGAASAGWLSDRLFGSRRNELALFLGLLEVAALSVLYAIPPGHGWADGAALGVFGFALGGLLVFVGGLMAVDIASQQAAGAAMGLVGAFSYAGAAIQNGVTGYLVDLGKRTTGDLTEYHFDQVFTFWIGTSVLSLLLVASLWRRKRTR